jgi:threonine dehydratase/serine racemase
MKRISPHVRRTPVFRSRRLDEIAGCQVGFKAENMQRSGAFKFRGALNALLNLPPDVPGVATHSSGNHGAALALAGQTLGIPVVVVVPIGAPAFKRENIARYGAQIVDCGPDLDAREATLAEVVHEKGLVFIPPYNDFAVICGQGTAALEMLEDEPEVTEIHIPVGGGGLASGTLAACSGAANSVRVIGAEPALADDAARSMETGVLQPPCEPVTVADGLRTSLGDLTFAMLRKHNLSITLVSEAEIEAAQILLIDVLKLVVEPSAAVPFAGLLKSGTVSASVGIILSGGNVALRGPSG